MPAILAGMFQFYRPQQLANILAQHRATAAAARQTTLDPRHRLERLEHFAVKSPERFLEWCLLYMPNAFPTAWGMHHKQIAEALCIRGQTVVVLEPREHGKTTELDAHDVYCFCNGFDGYVVRYEHDANIGTTKSKLFADQLLNNPAIVADYRPRKGNVWRPNKGELEICIPENPFATNKRVYFRSIGVLNISRGTTYNFVRIDRAVLNDVVADSREANSASWNNFLEHLILRDIGFAGGGGKQKNRISIYLVTTIQAKHDISDRLRNNPTVIRLQTPAILGDEQDVIALAEYVSSDIINIRHQVIDAVLGTPDTGFTGQQLGVEHFEAYCQQPIYQRLFAPLKSMWEAQFSLAKHVWDMYQSGTAAWLQERQHITADGAFQKFFAAWFDRYATLPDLSRADFGIAIDPAGKPRDGSDPVVILSGAAVPDVGGGFPDLYALDICCDQLTPNQVVYIAYAFAHRVEDDFGIPLNKQTIYYESQVGENAGTALFYETVQKELALGASVTYPDGSPRKEEYRDPAYWREIYVEPVHQDTDKIVRLLDFRVIAEQGRLHFRKHDPAHDLAVRQFENFRGEQTHKNLPLEQKIDIPDMCEMLYRKLNLPPVTDPVFAN